MTTKQPHQYPSRPLLIVSGKSPQVVTETVYALSQMADPAFIPTEIHLVTTTEGAEQARLSLLEGPRQFALLCQDYGLDPDLFTQDNIHIIHDADGKPLHDIRTPAQNRATADNITDHVRHLTRDDHTALHVSMAGGRKTMGYYAGYALSLFGRPQDRLSHVLVSEGYEGLPDFYYPTPQPRTIYNREKSKALDASLARVNLAEIPFVRLRDGMPQRVIDGKASFNEAVEYANLATQPPQLTLMPKQHCYRMNNVKGRLTPLQTALLLWLSIRHQQGTTPIETIIEGEDRTADANELQNLAEKYWVNLDARTSDTLIAPNGLQQGWLEQNISKTNKAMSRTLGSALASRCRIESRHIRGKRGYALPDDLTVNIE